MQHGGARARVIMAGLVMVLAGCSSGSVTESRARAEVPSTTNEPAPASTVEATTSTTEAELPEFEPLYADPDQTIREQVEAAYLYHWEILLDAGRTGRTEYLHLVYTDEALTRRMAEIEQFVTDGFRVRGSVEHNYQITVLDDDLVLVIDGYRNQMFRVDTDSGDPLDLPDGSESLYEYRFRKVGDRWLVAHVVRYALPAEHSS
jgi:hypothetical protein